MSLLQSNEVLRRCGNISRMTLWRWENDPEISFPKAKIIRSRRYWREDELQAWIEKRVQ